MKEFTKKKVVFHLYEEVWKQNIYLAVNFNADDIHKFIRHQFDCDWAGPRIDSWYGKCLEITHEKGLAVLICLREWSLIPETKMLGALAHECFPCGRIHDGSCGYKPL